MPLTLELNILKCSMHPSWIRKTIKGMCTESGRSICESTRVWQNLGGTENDAVFDSYVQTSVCEI